MFSVLAQIAGDTRQLEIARPVGAALGDRDDVVNVIAAPERFAAVSAASALCGKQTLNVGLRVGARDASSLGADGRLRRPKNFQMGEAVGSTVSRAFRGVRIAPFPRSYSRRLRIGSTPLSGIRSDLDSVARAEPSIFLCNLLGVAESPRSLFDNKSLSVSSVKGSPFSLPLLAIFGVPLRVVTASSSLLFGKKSSRSGFLLSLPTRSLRRSLIGCYNLVSHVERFLVRLVRSVAAPGPGCDASFYPTVRPQHQG